MRLPFNNEKLSAELTASCQRVLAIFPVRVFNASPATKKREARSYKVLDLSRKIILANLKISLLQNATPLRKSAPWPPNISDEHVSCPAPTTETASYIFTDPLQMSHACQRFWPGCRIPCTCHVKRRPNVQKCSEALNLSISDFLRAPTACHFFDISTSKKRSGDRQFLTLLTSKCASRHNGMHFFVISTLLKVLRSWGVHLTRCLPAPAALASLLFDPLEPQIIGKTQWIATFLPFRAPASSFFWLFLFSDLLSSSLLFSDSSHLCFSICPYCWLLNFLRQ